MHRISKTATKLLKKIHINKLKLKIMKTTKKTWLIEMFDECNCYKGILNKTFKKEEKAMEYIKNYMPNNWRYAVYLVN